MTASTLFLTSITRRIGSAARRLPASNLPRASRHFSDKNTVFLQDTTTTQDDEDDDLPTNQKRLDVAIVGFPNAGKSQLLNAIVGSKVAAVSRKRHTTRDGILGLKTVDDAQLVFCDTPGFMHTPDDDIGKDLMRTAKGFMVNVDYALVVIDAAKTKHTDDYLNTISTLMWNALHSSGGKFGIVLNKVDLVKPKTKLLDVAQNFGHMADVMILEQLKMKNPRLEIDPRNATPPDALLPEVFYTCAKKGGDDQGVQDLQTHLLEMAIPNREWTMPDAHSVTTMDYKARVEEMIREKVYRILHREVPHKILQRNRQLELIKGDSTESSVMMIHQDLLVRTKSHLKLLQSGQLQRIQEAAAPELKTLFGCEVLLTLNAKLISRNRR